LRIDAQADGGCVFGRVRGMYCKLKNAKCKLDALAMLEFGDD
jgi:hypothetical protein